jgi:hypothetical protein
MPTPTPPTARHLATLRRELLDTQFGIVNFDVYAHQFKRQGKTLETLSRHAFLLETFINLHTIQRN